VHEEGVVRPGGDDADLDPVLGVPVEVLVVDEHLLQGVEVVDGPLPVDQERLLVHLDVGRAPAPDRQPRTSAAKKHTGRVAETCAELEQTARHSLAPPQVLRGDLVLDDALVPGRPPGLGTRQRRQRAGGRDERPLLVLDGLLVQLCFFLFLISRVFSDKHHTREAK
jgi:hypothetical protein